MLLIVGSIPYAATGMQLLVAVTPGGVAAGTGSMQPVVDGGDWLLHDAGAGSVSKGDVIQYDAPDSPVTAHRAVFHVEAGENWYDRADPRFLGDADNCEELRFCPAPRPGWITKGDANPRYDQAAGRNPPVREEWIDGRVCLVVDVDDRDITLLSV
ncbi:S26 family signal peptidase [Haloferax volcanii]|nr:S26 family signal peptidase [Haloferax alexandrinus]